MVRKTSIYSLSKRVRKMEKEVELKESSAYTYSRGGGAALTTLTATAPQALLLNGLSQGTTQSTRVGDHVRATSVHLSGMAYSNTLSDLGFPVSQTVLRIVVFGFKAPRGTAPAPVGSQSAGAGFCPLFKTTSSNVIYPFTQYNTTDNCYEHYKVYSDTTIPFHNTPFAYDTAAVSGDCLGPSIQGKSICRFDIKVPLGCNVDYSIGNSGTIADINKNAIYVLFITDWSHGITGSYIEVDMDSTFYFKDA